MSQDTSFQDLIRRVRSGDEQAAVELLEKYEPDLRILARVRLTDPALCRLMDSIDVCQSVLCNFFVRAASGQFELETPEQLLKLLATMVRNKVIDHARRERSMWRDVRRVSNIDVNDLELAGQIETPSQLVAARELLDEFHARLTAEERHLVEQRKLGRKWEEIAKELGEQADSLRKRLTRAIDRVARELKLDETGYE